MKKETKTTRYYIARARYYTVETNDDRPRHRGRSWLGDLRDRSWGYENEEKDAHRYIKLAELRRVWRERWDSDDAPPWFKFEKDSLEIFSVVETVVETIDRWRVS